MRSGCAYTVARDRWPQKGIVSYASVYIFFHCLLFCIFLSKFNVIFTRIGYNSYVLTGPVSWLKKKNTKLRNSRMGKNGNRFFFLSSTRKTGFPIKHELTHKQINVSERKAVNRTKDLPFLCFSSLRVFKCDQWEQ